MCSDSKANAQTGLVLEASKFSFHFEKTSANHLESTPSNLPSDEEADDKGKTRLSIGEETGRFQMVKANDAR